MLTVTEMLAFALTLSYCWAALRRLFRTRYLTSAQWLCVIHFLLCGLPLLLDLTIGPPQWWTRLRHASEDPATRYCYALYVSMCPMLWWHLDLRRTNVAITGTGADEGLRRARLLLGVLLTAPILVVWFAPLPSLYLDYGVWLQPGLPLAVLEYHIYVAGCCSLAILAAGGLILSARRRVMATFWTVLPFVILACWINGKRHAVALALVSVGFALFRRGCLRGRAMKIGMAVTVTAFAAYSYLYQTTVRDFSLEDWSSFYHNYRLDYGRDHTIRLALYSELHSDSAPPILDYRGEDFVFYLTAPISRVSWPDKPWPYAVYFTSAALGLPRASSLGWGLTTSWLDECVASFGLLGCLIAPLSLSLFCRIGDSLQAPFLSILTHLCAALFVAVEPIGAPWLILLWTVTLGVTLFHRKLLRQKQAQSTLIVHARRHLMTPVLRRPLASR